MSDDQREMFEVTEGKREASMSRDGPSSVGGDSYGSGDEYRGAYARSTDPATSHEAAATVNVTKREIDAMRGLDILGGQGNCRRIAAAASVHEWSISPRFKPLEEKGYVIRTDGRSEKQIVWRLTWRGERYLKEMA
jgi:DNA-binding MarR family transcriptional regulator